MAQYLPTIDFTASPTLEKAFRCQDYFQGVEGPPGSGKSIWSTAKLGYYALTQEPDKDGWRRTRWAVIRNTYPDLRSTTIPTWQHIFKPEYCGPVVYSSPIQHHIKVAPRGGNPGVDMLVWFVPLDKAVDVRKLKSMELTGAWINEATEIVPEVLEVLTSRIGRYPSVGSFEDSVDGERPVGVEATWQGIIADTNAGDDENWWHKFKSNTIDPDLAENLKSHGAWTFFRQPPAVLEVQKTGTGWEVCEAGFDPVPVPQRNVVQSAGRYWCVNPEAENLRNLTANYYEKQLPNKRLEFIQRFLQVKTIYMADGKPWIPEYSDEMMGQASLPYDESLDLFGGLDIGGGTLQPAATIGQRGSFGDVRTLREFSLFEIGIDRFSDELAAFIKSELGVHHSKVKFGADPAGDKRDELFETSAIQHMKRKGFDVRPVETNDIKTRREAIAVPCGRLINTGSGKAQPGFRVDRSCTMLRAGLGGKWCTRRIQVSGTERFQETPEKNKWSHVCDADGYMCMRMGETRMFAKGGDPRRGNMGMPERRQVTPSMDFSPFGGNLP